MGSQKNNRGGAGGGRVLGGGGGKGTGSQQKRRKMPEKANKNTPGGGSLKGGAQKTNGGVGLPEKQIQTRSSHAGAKEVGGKGDPGKRHKRLGEFNQTNNN